MKGRQSIALIGDGIENTFNIEAMIHAADMFAVDCIFRNAPSGEVSAITSEQIKEFYSPVLVLENWKNAQVLYGYQLPNQSSAALIAGNERQGISREVAAVATQALSIPMISRQLNCINVAAASAVALYYLTRGFKGRMQVRKDPQKKRPEILFIGGSNHAELGSAIRSAAAFGWNRTFIEDRFGVWFGCDRVTRSEGRAAARRGRNQIRLIPCRQGNQYLFREAVIITTKELGPPLPKVDFCKGSQQVIIVPDESSVDVQSETWEKVADQVSFAQIDLPAKAFTYHYRHFASIALAEISRQVGQRAPFKSARQEPLYESSLKLLSEEKGEEVALEDLSEY